MLHVFLDPGVVDWDVVSKIETRLIYEDLAHQFNVERTFLVAQDSKRQEWIVRLTERGSEILQSAESLAPERPQRDSGQSDRRASAPTCLSATRSTTGCRSPFSRR